MTELPNGLIADHARVDLYTRITCVLNATRTHRYLLSHVWDECIPPMVWIMLNPSIANANQNDPTFSRCLHHSRQREAGGTVVVNLFALIATDHRKLINHPDAVGKFNDLVLTTLIPPNPWLVCAWGASKFAEPRAVAVTQLLANYPMWCLGTNENGSPKHPLYLPYNGRLEPYTPPQRPNPVV